MDINWFPGHMAKSTREIESSLKYADCALYVLDARAVFSCFNPAFDAMVGLPTVYVINKSDAVNPSTVKGWLDWFSRENKCAVAVEGTNSSCKGRLLNAIEKSCKSRIQKQLDRGLNKHIGAVVIGVPNTGKSTIINTLCGKARLVTGNRAGVTRSSLWARVNPSLDVLDTPGTLYPKITDRRVGENLAIIGSIKDEVVDITELANALIDRLNSIDRAILSSRYGLEVGVDGLSTIAKMRGFKARGGELDTPRAAATVIDDYRKGRLGKIALEEAV